MTDPAVSGAVRQADIGELDGRGLMPLAMARAVLRGNPAFVKGEMQNGVLASDVIWAALLSLEDAQEFCQAAIALDWQFHPRGMENVDLFRRYGNGIVPWLASRVSEGVLFNLPWCVVPCLLACDSPEAFELVWSIREVHAMTRVPLAARWLDRHPEVGASCLERRAETDPRACAQLAAMRARGLAPERQGLPRQREVLAHLDACALGMVAPELQLWPSKLGAGPRFCHGLRVVVARDADEWGIALERLEGDRPSLSSPPRVAVYAFGSRVHGKYRGVALGQRSVDTSSAPGEPASFAEWLRARGDAVWGPPESALTALRLPAGRVIATIPALAHVEPGERPSESDTYVAIVRAMLDG